MGISNKSNDIMLAKQHGLQLKRHLYKKGPQDHRSSANDDEGAIQQLKVGEEIRKRLDVYPCAYHWYIPENNCPWDFLSTYFVCKFLYMLFFVVDISK